jgi:hypothetical protein
MVTRVSDQDLRSRRGFTLIELLVAMAQIIVIMAILSTAFVEGLESFRNIKAIADLGERLRGEAIQLREDVEASNGLAVGFIIEGFRTRSVDLEVLDELRVRYESIGDSAADLEERLRAAEREVANPIARRLVRRTTATVRDLKRSAAFTIELLDLIESLESP